MAQLRQTSSKDLLVTAVASENDLLKFWGLPRASIEILNTYENHFKKVSSELEKTSGYLSSNQLPLGKPCVFYSQDQRKWFRARVIDILGLKEVVVQLMDYGSKEVVTVDNLRALDENIFRYPPLAVECILADVLPYNRREWSPEAVRFCEEQLVFETVSCYATSEFQSIPVVRIAKKGEGEPFVQRLINHGLAVIKNDSAKPQPAVQPVMNQTQPFYGYKLNRLDQNTVHLVKVSYVENVQKFYIQLAVAEAELKRLMDDIRSYSSSEAVQLVNAPNVGIPCLAPFPSKQLYYRGLITTVSQGRCAVLFVDYGYTELKEFQELRAIPNKFLSLQAQAIRCTLHNITEANHTEFCRIVKAGGLLDCHIVGFTGESYVVQLKEHMQAMSVQPKMLRPEITSYPRQSLDPSTSYPVTVSFINDVAEFYCQLTYHKEKLDQISDILNSGRAAIQEELELSECSPGMPVCVKFSEDNIWYRAQIVKINHEADIEVFFVDYGNFDNASLIDVRRMKPSLISFPTMAYKCILHDVNPPSDSSAKDAMYDMFEELTTGQNLTASITSVGDGSYSVILMEENASISLNEKLQSKFSGVPSVPVSTVEKLYVTCFTSPSCFFTQFEKLSSQKLEEMQTEINAQYAGSRNTSYRPKVGDIVCAKFIADQHFYRAKVENVTETHCSVFFIDYGNRETIGFHDVHPLNQNFMKEPQFGMDCALETCPPATPVEKLKSLLEENSIEARMIKEEKSKWIIALTENFPGNVAILELLRQHEMLVPRSIHGAGLRGFQEKVTQREDQNHYQTNSTSNFSKQQARELETRASSFSSAPKSDNESRLFSFTSFPRNAFRNVYVSHVVSPGEFYCQIEEESTKLHAMMDDLEDTYSKLNDNELKLKSMIVDSPCCAVFEEDGSWYRGQIKKVDPGSCTVYFVDYGNSDAVPVSKIKQLEGKFFTLPPQAVCCKLYNVSPDGGSWSDSAIDNFIEKALDKSFVAQFVEVDSKNVYSVNLVSIGKLQEEVLNKEFLTKDPGHLKDSNKTPTNQLNKTPVLKSYEASRNLTYQPPAVRLNSLEPVIVTYGLTPGEIFVQLKANERDFLSMMRKLQDYYTKVAVGEAIVDRPHQGMVCVAQFSLDSAWYRGEIRKLGNNSVLVYFVDYGNSENMDLKKIRYITQDFTMLPIQGIKCRLKDVKPPGASWSLKENISMYFEGNSESRFCSKEGDCYLIELFCNKANVAEQLVRDGIAASDSITLKPKATTITQSKWPERKNPFVPGQLLTVAVSFIQSPYKFWCQLSDEASVLDQLMADIETQYQDSTATLSGASIQVGSCCMAKYSEDDVWYRAKVTSKVSNEEYEVHFVDYGNSEVTTLDRLANISPKFLEIPPQCFECRLPGASTNDDAKITDQFQSIVDESEEITAKVENVSGEVYILSLLYEKDEEELNVSNVLYGENIEVTGGESEDTPKFLPFDIPLGPQEGYVTIVNTPHDFFIQLSVCEDDLAELSTELTELCEAMSEGEKTVPQAPVGCACAAKFSEDNNWYRAEVISIQGETADVLFVDYGNTSSVPLNTLKQLGQKHLDIPPYSIRCKLNAIASQEERWTQPSIHAFQNMVDDLLLSITFISKDVPALVNISIDDKDVAQSLIETELAIVETSPETEEAYADDHLVTVEDQLHSLPTDLSYPKRKLSSSKFSVKISYVDAYDKFFIMPLELSTELDTVMKTLELLYGDENKEGVSNNLEDPTPSLPCVAKYSEDEAWYRAIITDVSKNDIHVSFVDYGNSEITSLENLKPLTPELIKIPPIAIGCKLYGIQATEGREQEISAKLEEYYVEEIALEMEIVIKKELYEIKLSNEEGDFADVLCRDGLAFEVVASHDDLIESMTENLKEVVAENLQTAFVDLSEDKVSVIPQQDLSSKEQLIVSVKFCEIEEKTIVLYGVPKEMDEELAELQAALETAYNESERRLSQIKCNDFCAAKYQEDDCWYRARVLECDDEEKIKVSFLDYGNSDVVDKSSIHELLPEFMTKPQFCVKLSLTGFKVNEEKELEVQGMLDENVYEDSVVVQLCKYVHKSSGICFTSMVCGEVDILESLQNEKYLCQCYANFEMEEKFDGTIEYIAGDLFYILPVKLTEMRSIFNADLQSVCCDISASETDPAYLFAAEIDGSWSRVNILVSDNSSGSALVKAVDFGFETSVQLSQLKRLPVDMCHRPVVVVPCKINNIDHVPLNIQEKDLEKIKGIFFYFEVQKDSSSTLSVNLFEKKSDVSEVGDSTVKDPDVLEENPNLTIDSNAKEPVQDTEDYLSAEETFQESNENLIDSDHEIVEAKETPLSNHIGDQESDLTTEENEYDASEKETSPKDSDLTSHDVDSNAQNGFEVSNDSDVESSTKDLEMNSKEAVFELEPSEGSGELQSAINILSESDASLKTDTVALGNDNVDLPPQECKDVCESQDSEVEDNYNGVKDDENEVLDSESIQESVSGNVGSLVVEDNEWDERPECDIKEESLLEEEREEIESDSPPDCERELDDASNEVESKSALEKHQDVNLLSLSPSNPEEDLRNETVSQPYTDKKLDYVDGDSESKLEDPEGSLVGEEIESDSPPDCEKELGNISNEIKSKLTLEKHQDVDSLSLSPSNPAEDLRNEPVSQSYTDRKLDIVDGDSESKLEDPEVVAKLSPPKPEASLEEVPDSSHDKEDLDNSNKGVDSKLTFEDSKLLDSSEQSSKPDAGSKHESDLLPNSEEGLEKGDSDSKSAPKENLPVATLPDSEHELAKEDLDSKSTHEESTLVDSLPDSEERLKEEIDPTVQCHSGPEPDLEYEEEIKEYSYSMDPALFRLSGKTDVYIRDVAISNGSIILAVTSYPCYLELEKKLHHEFQKVYSQTEPGFSESSKLCAVLCDDSWYRGKILIRSEEEEELTVLLIDYGQCKTIPISNARELTPFHKDIPPFVAWCTLTHLHCPEEKSSDTKEYLDSVLTSIQDSGKIVSVEVIEEEEPYKVILFHEEDNISYSLLTENLVVQQLPEIFIASGEYSVKLSHASKELDKIYVNLVSNLDDIKTLKISMECSYPVDKVKASDVQLNMFYAVLHNGVWMRGKAVSLDEEMILHLIDTGETISAKVEVYPLLPLHCLQPPYAILCQMCDEIAISDKIIQELSKDEFQVSLESDLNTSKHLVAKVTDKSLIERLSALDKSNAEKCEE